MQTQMILIKMVNKTLLVLVFSVLAVQAIIDQATFIPEIRELAKNLRALCIPKTGVEEASIEKVIKGEFVDEPKIKAYMTCLITEARALDANGVWDLNLFQKTVPDSLKDAAATNAKTCDVQTKKIANFENKIFNFFKCYHDQKPDTFVFF